MNWLIRNGDYPYLEGLDMPAVCLSEPCPPIFWYGDGSGYPHHPEIPDNAEPLGCFANAARLHTVQFDGTAAAFGSVTCGTQWRVNAAFDKVICTDETVTV